MTKSKSNKKNLFSMQQPNNGAKIIEPHLHRYGKQKKCVCDTDSLGYRTPENRSPNDLVIHAPQGFIKLWDKNVTLRWRFNESSMLLFDDPEGTKTAIRELFGESLLEWEDALPVKFTESQHLWDFEIEVKAQENCSINGCVLASAFFPDAGRHKLILYPTMFQQSKKEQIETLCHETGHIFGLRHFFAKVSETAWPAEIFGKHDKFSIMNYGADSKLTPADKKDLKKLYQAAWAKEITELNGTPIRLVKPFSAVIEQTGV